MSTSVELQLQLSLKTIEYLVLSCGGSSFIQTLGILQKLDETNIINYKNIKKIYASSAGVISSLFLCFHIYFNYDWNIIYKYIVERPWQDVFKISLDNVYNMNITKGLFNKIIIKKCFDSFFAARNIDINITLNEFYRICPMELHYYVLDANKLELVDVSHKTHPNVALLDVVYMACAIPMLFAPVFTTGLSSDGSLGCYIDGGILLKYPLTYCINDVGIDNKDKILGIKNISPGVLENIKQDTNMFNYFGLLLNKILNKMGEQFSENVVGNVDGAVAGAVKYEINSNIDTLSFDTILIAINNINKRIELFNRGYKEAQDFIDNLSHVNV